jgi:hypothetical protein
MRRSSSDPAEICLKAPSLKIIVSFPALRIVSAGTLPGFPVCFISGDNPSQYVLMLLITRKGKIIWYHA